MTTILGSNSHVSRPNAQSGNVNDLSKAFENFSFNPANRPVYREPEPTHPLRRIQNPQRRHSISTGSPEGTPTQAQNGFDPPGNRRRASMQSTGITLDYLDQDPYESPRFPKSTDNSPTISRKSSRWFPARKSIDDSSRASSRPRSMVIPSDGILPTIIYDSRRPSVEEGLQAGGELRQALTENLTKKPSFDILTGKQNATIQLKPEDTLYINMASGNQKSVRATNPSGEIIFDESQQKTIRKIKTSGSLHQDNLQMAFDARIAEATKVPGLPLYRVEYNIEPTSAVLNRAFRGGNSALDDSRRLMQSVQKELPPAPDGNNKVFQSFGKILKKVFR